MEVSNSDFQIRVLILIQWEHGKNFDSEMTSSLYPNQIRYYYSQIFHKNFEVHNLNIIKGNIIYEFSKIN